MMEDLGSGFFLAMHDLEIRGAGEVLGDEQSGEMQQVGFQLYADMLKARGLGAEGRTRAGSDRSRWGSRPRSTCMHRPACPQDYCSDIHERLVLYKRLASCESQEELDLLREELVDRFGPTPEPAQALIACHRLRLVARPLGVTKIDASPERTTLQFVKDPPFDAGKLILLVQKDGRHPVRRVRTGCASSAVRRRSPSGSR